MGNGSKSKRKRPRTHGKGGSGGGKGSGGCGTVGGVLFLGVFLAAGLGFSYLMFGRPMLKVVDARDWPAVSCAVTSSNVHESSDSDGSTYRVEIGFAYDWQGTAYQSDTYSFFSDISSSGRSGKQRVVGDHPVGKATTCYVNPNRPTQAVIHRGASNVLWFALIPLLFVLVGGGGLVAMLFGGARKSWATKHAKRLDEDDEGRGDDWLPKLARPSERGSDVSLHSRSEAVTPSKSRLGGLVFAVVFALFWNGIVSVFVYQVFTGNAPWFVGLFMIPFVLVGLGAFVGVGYMVLALSNPVLELTFDPRVVAAGNTLDLSWNLSGRAERIKRLTVTVQGLERATYTRGTDTITDEHTFFEQTVYEADATDSRNPMAREAEVQMQVPADTMHSFDAANNKIVWRVKVRGEIPRWPDVKDQYDFAVVPAGMGTEPRGMF